MARLFEKDGAFRVVPMLGDAGAGNIALLLNDPSVDVAFVSIDALSAAAATDPTLSDRLELVVRLAPQEIHVLARTDIDSVADLAGRKVSFGPVGSSSAATAAALFKALSISVEAESLDASAAIERLKQGTIDAAVIVGGKPYPLIGAVPANSGVHLLPIPFGAPRPTYQPASTSATIPISFKLAARCRPLRPAWCCSRQRAIRDRRSASHISSKCFSLVLPSYRSRSDTQNGVSSTLLRACLDSAARKPPRHGSMHARQKLGQSRLSQAPVRYSPRQYLKQRRQGTIKGRCSAGSSSGDARRTISARK